MPVSNSSCELRPEDHHLEAERGEQREPERVVLVHVEHAWNADFAAGGLLVGQTTVGEATLVFVVVQVGPVGTLLLRVSASFATVTGHVAGAVLECGDGELAVVLAQLAHVTFGRHRQVVEFAAGHDVRCGVAYACDRPSSPFVAAESPSSDLPLRRNSACVRSVRHRTRP